MKRIATVAILLIGTMTAGVAMAKSKTAHVHYCDCGDPIGAAMCGTSTSSTSTGGTTTSSSSSSGGTSTSSSTSSGGTSTSSSSTSGGTAVPEPAMLGMMGLGFIGMAIGRRRRR